MNRYAKNRNVPHPPPVEKVDVDANPSKARMFVFVLLLAIGAAALSYGFYSLVTGQGGWQRIEADAPNAGDFTLLYDVGVSGKGPAAENRALSARYAAALTETYQAFSSHETFADVNNLRKLNDHPNETFEVPAALYNAFALLGQYGDRTPYLAPAYEIYDDIFTCDTDESARYYDPAQNPEMANWYAEVAAFACDESAVNVELAGENRLCLRVSDEYLHFADDNEITTFVDLTWMENAFTVDWVAQNLLDGGFVHGSIASLDGYTRNLDDNGPEYQYNFYTRDEDGVKGVAVFHYAGMRSFVRLSDYAASPEDLYHVYCFDNGERLTCYMDPASGMPRAALDTLTGFADDLGCAELLLLLRPIYVAETWQPARLEPLASRGVYAVYRDGKRLFCTKSTAVLSENGVLRDS